MAAKTPQSIAAKWAQRLGGAGQAYKDGIQSVTIAPSQLAIAQQDRARQGFVDAIDSGRWARKLGMVTLSDWQRKAVDVGAGRLTSGATAALPKVQAFMAEFYPVTQQVKQTVAGMPKGGEANAVARFLVARKAFKAFAGKND